MRNTIELEAARRGDETGHEIKVGMCVVLNIASGQVLSVARDVLAAHSAAEEIESEHDVELDVRLVV